MNQTSWSTETKKVFNGILLFSAAWIVSGICSPIGFLLDATGIPDIIAYLVLAGAVLTIVGLESFGNSLDETDRKAIGSVRTAFMLVLVSVALDALPFLPDIVGDIVYLAAIILMLLGYGNLKKSATFAGKAGASTLFVAMILLVVGWVLDFIPLVGDWLEAVLTIVAYIMTLLGWNKIKNAAVAG
jgi:hypothetical protein